MTSSSRRVALLTGVSAAAMGFAFPANAQVSPGTSHVVTGTSVEDTLVICDIDEEPTPDCFYGVIDEGPATAVASVDTVPTGLIEQIGEAETGTVDLLMVNNGDAEIGAIAVAGSQYATTVQAMAQVGKALRQVGSGPDDVALDFENNGELRVVAFASAAGSAALANADVAGGLLQHGYSTGEGDVSVSFLNDGAFSVVAGARAEGETFASARGHLNESAIEQTATAEGSGNASVSWVNAGTALLSAAATAIAESGNAFAEATVEYPVYQKALADAGGYATAEITNAGSLTIAGRAAATALAGWAHAAATSVLGVSQFATAVDSGIASVSFSNSGAVEIAASALANGGVHASAIAVVRAGVIQQATATGGASVVFANDGSFRVGALASAAGGTAHAFATATDGLLLQTAVAYEDGAASARFINGGEGVVDISAVAIADAADPEDGGGSAVAGANLSTVVWQSARVSIGDALVTLTNDGEIGMSAIADARGGYAEADANMRSALFQTVIATWENATTTQAGNAVASIENSGSISLLANAVAIASSLEAGADATVMNAVLQSAIAPGSAEVLLGNTGNITVEAIAAAEAAEGAAHALAYVTGDAINQYAVGGVQAVADLTNSGSIVIGADALADAGGGYATAHAAVGLGIHQEAIASSFAIETVPLTTGSETISRLAAGAIVGEAAVSLSNEGLISISANAHAYATGAGHATAEVSGGILQHAVAGAVDLYDASAFLANGGTISVGAEAEASGSDVSAVAHVGPGIAQLAEAEVGVANAYMTNTGTVAVHATAFAYGTGPAFASALAAGGLVQQVSGATAYATMANSGYITANAHAIASATEGSAEALADAFGISQRVTADAGSAYATNSGEISVAAQATAFGYATANAEAAAAGAQQFADGVSATFVNSGLVAVTAGAEASGTDASAVARAGDGIAQFVAAETGHAYLTSTGTVALHATAEAYGTGAAVASAIAGPALLQDVAGASGYATMVNAGYVTASANALAVATDGSANALAAAFGLNQIVAADAGSAYMTNSGELNVAAHATASGYDTANAEAYAVGAQQHVNGAAAYFANSGVMNVEGSAFASGAEGSATGYATGYFLTGAETVNLLGAIDNSGTMNVVAEATAPDNALAIARGIRVEGGPVELAIDNDGEINVLAFASGGTSEVPDGEGGYATVGLSVASATGILVEGEVNNSTITNSGSIIVEAITDHDGEASAAGIRVASNGAATGGTDDVLTINNSGDIVARVSGDGGETFRRGFAIDVAEQTANPTVINLLGGDIYGHIDIKGDDEINVAEGTTYFDGIINPEFLPAGGITEDDLDSGLFGEGTLNILAGGNLILGDPRITGDPDTYDGPAYAFVETLNIDDEGTITFQLQPETEGVQEPGTYPQIFADVANIDGTLSVEVTPANGLYDDRFVWNNLIDANELNGEFDTCQISDMNSLLLTVECEYDEDANVDFAVERLSFDSVDGLNRNGRAVGAGLECIYDPSLTGGIADLLSDLFLIEHAGDYNVALNMLAGASYANYLQSFPSLGVHYNDVLDRATSCEVPSIAGSVIECRASTPLHVWGQVDYQKRNADGDGEAGAYNSKRASAFMGMDAKVGDATILGASVGVVGNHVNEHRFGDDIDGDGMQLGLYGVYDPGAFYVKALTTYSWFDGDSRRDIDLTPFGATFGGTTRGDPDVKMWTLGLHAGARFALSANSVATPYLNLDYVHAKMDEFIEEGLDGANLHVDHSGIARTFMTVGAKWAGQMGGIVPEVNLGYRHRFGNRRAEVTEAFMCQTDTCAFDIVSASEKRGSLLLGLSAGGKAGPVDLRLGYEGEYNADVRSHSLSFKAVLPLGGRKAPPPPVVEAPPPPPPPPATQTCPDGSVILATDTCPVPPPPPPPPPPAPERG